MTASPTHRYHARCHWQGSTAAGYESYDRAHRGAVPPALGPIDLSADAAFRGDPQRCNPEQLAEYAPRRARLALDLGCGPGATTRLVAEAIHAERTVGLAARGEHAGAGMEFVERSRSCTRTGFS